jgi:mannose-6-phosphate isomerase-like protein (cupin superfamily)
MRQVAIAVLMVALMSDPATSQAPFTPTAPSAVPARVPGASKREAEKRRRRIDFLEASSMSGQAEWLRQRRGIGMSLLTSGDEQTEYLLLRRTVSSEPEVHARWDDIVIVRSGTGAVEMGDSLVGSRYRAPGERAGGKFTKSHQLVLHAGDVMRIPAAVPHAFIVSGSEPLVFLVIKQRRQELPIRWYSER